MYFVPQYMTGGLTGIAPGLEAIAKGISGRMSPESRQTRELIDNPYFWWDYDQNKLSNAAPLSIRNRFSNVATPYTGANGEPLVYFGGTGPAPQSFIDYMQSIPEAQIPTAQSEDNSPVGDKLSAILQQISQYIASHPYTGPDMSGRQQRLIDSREAGGPVENSSNPALDMLLQLIGIDKSRGEVPVRAHEGEFILNKEATQAIGEQNLNALNQQAMTRIPKRETGGAVTDYSKASNSDLVSLLSAGQNVEALVELKRRADSGDTEAQQLVLQGTTSIQSPQSLAVQPSMGVSPSTPADQGLTDARNLHFLEGLIRQNELNQIADKQEGGATRRLPRHAPVAGNGVPQGAEAQRFIQSALQAMGYLPGQEPGYVTDFLGKPDVSGQWPGPNDWHGVVRPPDVATEPQQVTPQQESAPAQGGSTPPAQGSASPEVSSTKMPRSPEYRKYGQAPDIDYAALEGMSPEQMLQYLTQVAANTWKPPQVQFGPNGQTVYGNNPTVELANQLLSQYGGANAVEQTQIDTEGKQLQNDITRQYGAQATQADITYKLALAQNQLADIDYKTALAQAKGASDPNTISLMRQRAVNNLNTQMKILETQMKNARGRDKDDYEKQYGILWLKMSILSGSVPAGQLTTESLKSMMAPSGTERQNGQRVPTYALEDTDLQSIIQWAQTYDLGSSMLSDGMGQSSQDFFSLFGMEQ